MSGPLAVSGSASRPVNVMTVDVEDYFQVSGFEDVVSRDDWDSFESRVAANVDRMLEIFNDAGTRATFFVLGWVAERLPHLVRQIAMLGHEVGSHGYDHRLLVDLSPAEFRRDLRRAKAVLEDAIGAPVNGFRAPSFSLTQRSFWAVDILIEEGFTYDSSIFPTRRRRGGMPGTPRHAYPITRSGGTLWELPSATIRLGGMTMPLGGGGYFRLFPYAWTRLGIEYLNGHEHLPAVVYLHPWEMDPGQPRIAGRLANRFRHYVNLDKTEPRLKSLVRDFAFGPARLALARPSLGFPTMQTIPSMAAAGRLVAHQVPR